MSRIVRLPNSLGELQESASKLLLESRQPRAPPVRLRSAKYRESHSDAPGSWRPRRSFSQQMPAIFALVTAAHEDCVPPEGLGTVRGIYLIGKYRPLAATNFEFVAIGVFEKEGVITRTIAFANFRAFELFPAHFAHELCNPIHFRPRIGPKRDSCAIRFVVLIWTNAKEFRWSVAASGIKSMEVSPGFFVNESKLWQKFSVKLCCHSHVFYP